MQVIKYSTEHLVCHKVEDKYLIFEKGDMKNPICIYIDKKTMWLADKVSQDREETYEYFLELGEIIQTLWDLTE